MLDFSPFSLLALLLAASLQPAGPGQAPAPTAAPATIAPVRDSARQTLRYRFEPGQTFRYRVLSTTISDFDAQPGAPASRTVVSQSYTLAFQVVETAADATPPSAKIKAAFQSIRAEAPSLADLPMIFDSADLTNKQIADNPNFIGYRALLGKVITFTMDNTGKVTSLSGASEALDAAAVREDFNDEQRHNIAAFKETLSNRSFTDLFNRCFYVVPPQAVANGESWEIAGSTPMQMIGGIRSAGTAKVSLPDSSAPALFVVTGASKITLDSGQAGPLAAMMSTRIDPSASQDSILKFDAARGRLVLSESSTQVPMELTMKTGALGAPNQGGKPSVTRGLIGSRVAAELLEQP